jgi:hypothetical protein
MREFAPKSSKKPVEHPKPQLKPAIPPNPVLNPSPSKDLNYDSIDELLKP